MTWQRDVKTLEETPVSNAPSICIEQEGPSAGGSSTGWTDMDRRNNFVEESRIDSSRGPRSRPARVRGERKLTAAPSRFSHLPNDFEFAAWGSVTYVTLTENDQKAADESLQEIRCQNVLGQFTASALAGNAVLGSVFYALPAVIAVSGVYSPISLFIAALVLFLWRPIMEELGSALPLSGAPYTYLLNVSTKSFALVGATVLLLDFTSTSVVSAATAASYLGGEMKLPFPEYVAAALVLLGFTLMSLSGVKESARIALAILLFHMGTMLVLITLSCAHLRKIGPEQLWENWNAGAAVPLSSIVHQIFYGFCLGMLGLTGFECIPSYIGRIKKGQLPLVLRNLHLPAIALNTTIVSLVLAIVPLGTVLNSSDVLSVLAQSAAGNWLRIWIVLDASIVLCGGVLTGILSANELLEQLALHRVLPKFFLQKIPQTGSPYVSALTFAALSSALYSSAGADLSVISRVFSIVWLTVMSLFPFTVLLLQFNRARLPRAFKTPPTVIFATIIISVLVFVGNVVVDPTTAWYFAVYFLSIVTFFLSTQNKVPFLRYFYWIYDQYPSLHSIKSTEDWGSRLGALMMRLKCEPVCILVKNDEIHHLLEMMLYVRKNEETSNVKVIYFDGSERGIPSDLQSTTKSSLDGAFPEITIDLIIVKGAAFNPSNIIALSHRLDIPTSLMFMACPGTRFPYSISDLGTRIISF